MASNPTIFKIFGIPVRTLEEWKNRNKDDWRWNIYNLLDSCSYKSDFCQEEETFIYSAIIDNDNNLFDKDVLKRQLIDFTSIECKIEKKYQLLESCLKKIDKLGKMEFFIFMKKLEIIKKEDSK